MSGIKMDNFFEFETQILEKGTKHGQYVIRVPVVWAAEIVKDYPEHGQDFKSFMTYEEIEKIVKTHKEFTITENHVRMTDKAGKIIPIPKELNIGTIKNLKADPIKRCGRGIAYINRSKVSDFIANMLMRGGVLGVSGGGFAGKLGPGGHHKKENYTMTQMDVKMHHMALVTRGIPRCPTNVCGFNIAEIFVDSGSVDSYIKTKIPIYRAENPDWTQAHITVAAIKECQLKLGIKSSFNFESETLAPEEFKELYEYLIFEHVIEREDCVHDFYIDFKNAWNKLPKSEGKASEVGIIKEEDYKLITNQNLLKIAENKMADEKLLKKIEELEAKNKKLQDAQLKDTIGTIEELRESITSITKENTTLKLSLVDANKIAKEIQDRKAIFMVKTLTEALKADNTPVYSPQELAQLSFEKLEETFNMAKRFLGLPEMDNSAILAPQPQMYLQPQPFINQAPIPFYPNNQGYSIPVYAPQVPTGQNTQPQMYDAAGKIVENQGALGQNRIIQPLPAPGTVPSPEELFDEKNPRWKSNDPHEDKNLNDPRGII